VTLLSIKRRLKNRSIQEGESGNDPSGAWSKGTEEGEMINSILYSLSEAVLMED